MRTILIIIGIIVVIIIGIILFKYVPSIQPTFSSLFPKSPFSKTVSVNISKATVDIHGHTIKLLLAKTPDQQHQGLSDRDSLPQDTGMLFIFNSPGYPAFWMRHMKFPLDIIYINGNKVVDIYNNVQNPPYTMENAPIIRPKAAADKVLEINAGLAQKYGLKVGDTIQISNI